MGQKSYKIVTNRNDYNKDLLDLNRFVRFLADRRLLPIFYGVKMLKRIVFEGV